MSLIRFKFPALLCIAVLLCGCGLTQRVADSTKEVASAIFYKQIKTLHLDFVSRSALNTDAEDTPLSTMVHVWQLKTRERFDEADYDTLFMQEEKTLAADVLAEHTVWVKPEGAVSLNVPLDKDTQFIAIVGQFYQPDEKSGSWKLVLTRDELEADKPRTIELMRSDLRLLPLQDK
ncbi:type VI secretion system lipoprotein TssJ [Salmonella enterica]|nr:type VI secretion system lipoprotein TssJ [Salmonella enterica]EDV3191977.1 type VI secretion system lipoprotein TssJ [Salmonella enterica]EDX3115503.1 type VI secretion system lipoprotein TssJ [Salmonella enterica subsp. enterica serovar Mississippi]